MDRFQEWLQSQANGVLPPPPPLPPAPLFGAPSVALGPMTPPMGMAPPPMPFGAPPAPVEDAAPAAPAPAPAPSAPPQGFMSGGWRLPGPVQNAPDQFGSFLQTQGIQGQGNPQPTPPSGPNPLMGRMPGQGRAPVQAQPNQLQKPEDVKMPRPREATRFKPEYSQSNRTQRLIALARQRRR